MKNPFRKLDVTTRKNCIEIKLSRFYMIAVYFKIIAKYFHKLTAK